MSDIHRETKTLVCKTLVNPVLPYESETWNMNNRDEKTIDIIQRCIPKTTLKVR